MESCYYELRVAPDFSLHKYSTLSETGPSGVLTQHQAFWRQLNQWGKLFQGSIHLFYLYNPEESAGYRLKLVIRFDTPSEDGIKSIQQIMKASILAPYYDALTLTAPECLDSYQYPWQVNLMKKEHFITASSNEKEEFYITSKWEMNQNARLYSMMRIMASTNLRCAYCVDIYPVDYSNKVNDNLSYVLSHLRELVSFKVKAEHNSVASGGRDENAKKALNFYEDLIETLNCTPHFLINVQVLGETEAAAKQIVDAAASEALQEGNHNLYGERFGGTVQEATNGFACWSEPTSPEKLAFLPHLATLEQLVPFAVLPVLFPGETIEMPKETVPKKQEGMLLGKDEHGHDIYFPWRQLPKHAFMAGMPGSGKTNTMMYLVSEMHKAGIPVLVLEPAKKEYRVLTTLPEMANVSLFSPCANSLFPIHINPFEFPEGMKLADHINRLLDVFNGTFQLDAPMPMLLTEGIQACYEDLKWLPGMVNRGELTYPTMSMLYEKIEKLLDKYEYAPDIKSNLKSVLQVRIGSLLAREMGDIFDVQESTFPPQEWIRRSAVVELASLGTGPSNFLMLMLMTLIRETLSVEAYDPEAFDKKPRHVIFIEEAHNLIADTSVQPPGGLDPKISATAYVTKMLAEVRALGEGIVIADQLPTAMAPEVVKNTSLKIGLRLTSQDERQILGTTMSADGVQMERMGIFTPGRGLVSYEDLQKPFEMQIPKFKGDAAINDDELLKKSICKVVYQESLQRSADIMYKKFRRRRNELTVRNKDLEDAIKRYKNGEIDKEGALKTKIHKKYNELMKKWCRLTLDALIYMGVTEIRKEVLISLKQISKEERKKASLAHNKWLALIKTDLYKSIQKERQNLDCIAKTAPFELVNEEKEQSFRAQQTIVAKSWR